MAFRPLHDRVLIRRVESEEKPSKSSDNRASNENGIQFQRASSGASAAGN